MIRRKCSRGGKKKRKCTRNNGCLKVLCALVLSVLFSVNIHFPPSNRSKFSLKRTRCLLSHVILLNPEYPNLLACGHISPILRLRKLGSQGIEDCPGRAPHSTQDCKPRAPPTLQSNFYFVSKTGEYKIRA